MTGAGAWLMGWKAISGHLGISVATAKRWEKQYSLPVLRTPGGGPCAAGDELDAYLILFNLKMKEREGGMSQDKPE